MIRKLQLLAATTAYVLALCANGAHAQHFSPDGLDHLLRCELWNPVPGDKAGARRRLFVLQLVPILEFVSPREYAVAGSLVNEARVLEGTFLVPIRFPLAFWSEPEGKNPANQFTTRLDALIEFTPTGEGSRKVLSGVFTKPLDVRSSATRVPSVLCIRPEGIARIDPEPTPLPSPFAEVFKRPASPPPAPAPRTEPDGPLARLFREKPATAPSPPARSEPEPKPEPKRPPTPATRPPSLTELFKPSAPAPPPAPSAAPAEPTEKLATAPPAPPTAEAPMPIDAGAVSAHVQIEGTGPRTARRCTIVLKPSATLGDTLAPRLRLLTEGLDRLSFGLANESEFGESELVRNNTRQPFAGGASVTAPQFRTSDIGKAVASQRVFFVTAKRKDSSKYVSNRYELPDFDAILARVEASCAFDAEALMADVSTRVRAEQSLALSASDLKLIRWALARKYAGSFAAPEPRSELGDADRMYLRRYAVENGLPASRYLTAELARKLAADGAAIAGLSAPASPTAPPPLPSRYSDYFVMCAQASGEEAMAACNYAITSGIYRGVDLGRAYNNRGVEYAQRGDLDRAIADYGEAIRLEPTNVKALHNRGYAWSKKGEYERAVADFDAVLRLDPNAGDTLIERGFAIADGLGDHPRAILDYNRALRLRLSSHGRNEAYGGRGRANFCLANYAAAAPDLVRALQAEADDPYSVLQLFIARVHTGNRAAQKELERNAARLKENGWPFAAIELLLGRRTPDATMAAARIGDQRCEAHYYVGEWHLLHDARTDAIAAFRRAAETCKRNFIEYYGAVAELKALGE